MDEERNRKTERINENVETKTDRMYIRKTYESEERERGRERETENVERKKE